MKRTVIGIVLIAAVIAATLGGSAATVVQTALAATQPRAALRAFTLVAEPVRWQIQPGLVVEGWGRSGCPCS